MRNAQLSDPVISQVLDLKQKWIYLKYIDKLKEPEAVRQLLRNPEKYDTITYMKTWLISVLIIWWQHSSRTSLLAANERRDLTLCHESVTYRRNQTGSPKPHCESLRQQLEMHLEKSRGGVEYILLDIEHFSKFAHAYRNRQLRNVYTYDILDEPTLPLVN